MVVFFEKKFKKEDNAFKEEMIFQVSVQSDNVSINIVGMVHVYLFLIRYYKIHVQSFRIIHHVMPRVHLYPFSCYLLLT